MDIYAELKKKSKDISVLYVEDDEGLRVQFKIFLSRIFDNVEVASNGLEALHFFNEKRYELVITDIRMPKMDGLKLTENIKSTSPDTEVIITSAYDEKELLFKAIEVGVNHYVLKPIAHEHLLSILLQSVNVINLRKDLEKEKEKQRIQEEFLIEQSKIASIAEIMSAIAHQWRQPLNIISLNIQSFVMKYQLSNEINEDDLYLLEDNTMKQLEYMSKTIDDFKSFFQPSKEKEFFDLKKSVVNVLNLIVDDLENNFIEYGFVFNGKSYQLNEVELNKYEENFLIYGYPTEFGHALLNIILNSKDAIKARVSNKEIKSGSGKITLLLNISNESATIEINDNGGGIKNELMSKIFEPYFTTKFESLGTGMGLYMTKMIIEKNMNGKVYLKNIEDGVSFIIELHKNMQKGVLE